MRILMLTQWFNPEPGFKILPFAKELIKLGHKVEVLTGFPNYPEGKLYEGYRIRILQREIIEGVPILRVPLYPSHDNNPIRRSANYASFAFSASIIGPILARQADIAYVYHGPATVGLPAVVFRFLRQMPFVYDVQDLWPDVLEATGMLTNKRLLLLVDKWCNFIYKQASRVVTESPGFKEALINRGVPINKIEVIYNWCDESHIQAASKDESLLRTYDLANRFNIVYAGTMGKVHALDAVLDAAKQISGHFPKIQFIFVGGVV